MLKDEKLIGFISIFPNDSDIYINLTPWYATLYVKKEERGKGYSKLLNEAIIKKSKLLNIKTLYLKTTLNNYYEKLGVKILYKKDKEKIYKLDI